MDDSLDGQSGVLLRNNSSEFTTEELTALSRIELPDRTSDFTVDDLLATGSESFSRFAPTKRLLARPVTLHQLVPREMRVGGSDSMADAILSTHQLHLENKGLHSMDLLECFLNLTHLYIQHNHISSLDGLGLLIQLSVLVVHHNNVSSLRPLAALSALNFLDARFNVIETLDPQQELPCASLRYVSLLGNPCCRASARTAAERLAYRCSITEVCPKLEFLDDLACHASNAHNDDGEAEDEDEESEEETDKRESLDEEGKERGGSSRLRRVVASCRTAPSTPPPPNEEKMKEETNCSARECLSRLFHSRITNIHHLAEHHANTTLSEGTCLALDESSETDALPNRLLQNRHVRSRLYDDMRFAQETDGAREQRLLDGVWTDVANVMRTRHALVDSRRERLEAERTKPSLAYAESLALLQREGSVKSLDKYRKALKNDKRNESTSN